MDLDEKQRFAQHLRLRAAIVLRRFQTTRHRSDKRWREAINDYICSPQGTVDMFRAAKACGLTTEQVGCFGIEAPYLFVPRGTRLASFAFIVEDMWNDYLKARGPVVNK